MNFWQKLKKEHARRGGGKGRPLMVLAPMADVTDPAFRRIIAKYGKPDVLWTEFVSSDGLFLGGREALEKDLKYAESERPIIAQFFTSKPEMMRKSAELAVELGFDGIDINMGCPDKSIEKQGAGAGLMKNLKLAQEIILAAKEGACIQRSGLGKLGIKGQTLGEFEIPVSVKTRIGYNKNELETWLPALLETKPAVITIHCRTRKEMSLVPARWEHIKRAVEIRDAFRDADGNPSQTLIFGNGDVLDLNDARKKAEESGCDGVMLGRAIFGNPWLFANLSRAFDDGQIECPAKPLAKQDIFPIKEEKLRVLVEHTKLFEELCSHKSFAIMKKHFKAYVHGWDGAKEFRMKLMDADNASEVERTINDYLAAL